MKLHAVSLQQKYASILFAKIGLTLTAILKLLPGSKYFSKIDEMEIWDISSTCSLTRDLIECYRTFHYLTSKEIREEEFSLRLLVWRLHAETRRLEMVELMNSDNGNINSEIKDGINAINETIVRLKWEIQNNGFFLTSDPKLQQRCLLAKEPFILTREQISSNAGINHNYYIAANMFLSNYVHSYPFSIFQLEILKAGTDELLHLFTVAIQYCLAFVCLTIRDFEKVYPEQTGVVPEKVKELIKISEHVVKNIVRQSQQ